MRMGWMVMLVPVMAATMPPIVMEQADAAVVGQDCGCPEIGAGWGMTHRKST